jgi:hypothetical protein
MVEGTMIGLVIPCESCITVLGRRLVVLRSGMYRHPSLCPPCQAIATTHELPADQCFCFAVEHCTIYQRSNSMPEPDAAADLNFEASTAIKTLLYMQQALHPL